MSSSIVIVGELLPTHRMVFVLFFRGISVEYTKGQHLYHILVPSAHILPSFCIRIGAFDRSRVFGLM